MSSVCPICKKPSGPRPENKAAPFCSARCRQIDLGQWLEGAYRVPVEGSELDGGLGGDAGDDGDDGRGLSSDDTRSRDLS